MNKKHLILCAAVLCTAAAGYSQENKKSKVPSEVVSVEKGYNPEVKTGKKVNFTAEETAENTAKLPVNYKNEADAPQFDFAAQPVSALVISGKQPSGQYSNYIKGGIGYNVSSQAEGYYSLTRGKTTFGAGLNHDRAVRDISFFKDNSVFSHTDASVSVKHAFNRYDLGGYAKYTYDAFTNNGMRLPESDYVSNLPLVLRHNGITVGASLRSNDGPRIFDYVTLEGSYLNGANSTYGSYFKGSAGLLLPVKKVVFSLDVAGAYYKDKWMAGSYSIFPPEKPGKPETGDIEARYDDFEHFTILPGISYKNGRLDLYGGIRMEIMAGSGAESIDSDGEWSSTKFHIMPEIKAAYSIVDGLMSVYGRLESGYRMQDRATLVHENPFMSSTSQASYAHEKFKATLGLSGVFSSKVRYDVNASYGQTNGIVGWLLMIHPMNEKAFLSYYSPWQDDVKLFTLKGSADYTITPDHRVGAFVQYNHSSSSAFDKALYVPDFRVGASYFGSVVDKKIDLSGRIAYNGSSDAYIYSSKGTKVTMDGYVEFEAEATYNFTPRWSLFVEANNTIDGRTVKYYGYDWCGIRALVGVKFRF